MSQFKNTKIGRLPLEWEVKKLGEIGVFSRGKGILKEQVLESGLPCIRYGEIYTRHNFEIKEFYSFISEDLAAESQKIKKGDLLFAGSGEILEDIGKTVVFTGDENAFAGGDILILSPDIVENDCTFLSFQLNSSVSIKQKRKMGQGHSVVHIYSSELKNLKIPIPLLPEQQKIAQILRGCDATIATTQKLITALQCRHKGLMQQLLLGKMRVKGFEKTKWEDMKLGDVFKERNETNCNDLPLLSITEHRGVIYRDELDKKDTSNEDKSKYRRICFGDIGYNTMRMWQGRSAVSSLEGIVSPAYTIVTPKSNAHVNYFGYLFKTSLMIHTFWRHSQGLVDDTLNCKYDNFQKIKINLPSFTEQKKIAQILRGSEEEIALQKKRLSVLQEQKRGLMQVLLTGKVRVRI
jgi:type I restriction enzyme, S subunit